MNISSDYYSSSQSYTDSLLSNSGSLNEALSGATKTTTQKATESSEKTKTTTDSTTTYRETYGLSTLEQMSDEEYAAFERATATMSPNEKIQAAQSLHLVAKSFEQAQQTLNGGGLVQALSGDSSSSGYFTSNPDMLDKGIAVLKNMSNNDGKSMANFLTRYRGALYGGGLNISA